METIAPNGNGRKVLTVAVPVTAVVALLVGAYLNMANQTAVAIDIARQHGEELSLLRKDYTNLSGQLQTLQRTLSNNMGDRFRGQDALHMEDRIMERMRMIEARLSKNGI